MYYQGQIIRVITIIRAVGIFRAATVVRVIRKNKVIQAIRVVCYIDRIKMSDLRPFLASKLH